MTEDITVMTWNTNGDAGVSQKRIRGQKDFFSDHHGDTDLFLLQAVQYATDDDEKESHFQELKDYFEDRGYHIAHTRDWSNQLRKLDVQPYHNISSPFSRCKITASRWSIDRKPLDLRNRGDGKPVGLNYFYTNFLTGPFVSDVHIDTLTPDDVELEVWNTGIIHGSGWKEEKINALETIYGRIYLQNRYTDRKVILGGDFNAPKREVSEQRNGETDVEIEPHHPALQKDKPFYGNPYRYQDPAGEQEGDTVQFTFRQRWENAESYIFDSEKSDWNMKDAYWYADDSLKQSSVEDYSFDFPLEGVDNKRLDHILADETQFDIICCEVQNGHETDANGFDASDHAAVKATLEIKE
ncbi:hypothetical protein BRC90_02830 [Halobacteriales archaeon QS_4_69_34]|nr:MAG: hypothetical protein BRC90_02830 [Halobacteriales archaeon QS_4_69_34]